MTVVEGSKNSSDGLCQGIIINDGEYWCIKVTEAEYKAAKGEDAWKKEWEAYHSWNIDPKYKTSPDWYLYPQDLVHDKFEGKYCRISVHVEFIKTAADGALDNITNLEDLPESLNPPLLKQKEPHANTSL